MMRTTKHFIKLQLSFFNLALLLSVLPTSEGSDRDCGDYFKLGPADSGRISSPRYPGPYSTYTRCIWVLETTDPELRVKFTFSYSGERYNGKCTDYLQIRDGSQYSNLLGEYCDTHVNTEVVSTYMYMWVLFKSDGINGNGSVWTATFSTKHNETAVSNTSKPYIDCHSYEFECRNHVCLSMSYRCDNYNDCGCVGECDEDECTNINLTIGAQIAISIAVGVVTFLIVCVISFLLEGQHSWITNVSEAKRERENHDEERRKRVSRAFSKFIGNSGGSITKHTDSTFNNNTGKSPVNGVNNSNNNGTRTPNIQINGLPSNSTVLNVPDMTVTDIDT